MSKRKLALEEMEAASMESNSDEDTFYALASETDPEYSPENSSAEDDVDNVVDVMEAMAMAEENEDLLELLDDDGQENDNTTEGRSRWTEYVGRHKNFEFIGKHGLQSEISQQSTPLDIFLLFVDDQVINHIVVETNRFAEQNIASKPKLRHVRMNKWNKTDPEEIKKFLGLTMWMGLVPLGHLEYYWSQNGVYKMTVPHAMISRNRFQALLAMIHFNNNETSDRSNRLGKINQLIDMLDKKFKAIFYPGKDFLTYETLVPWKGRLIFKQYIPNKAHHYGVKLFKLCSVDGFTWV